MTQLPLFASEPKPLPPAQVSWRDNDVICAARLAGERVLIVEVEAGNLKDNPYATPAHVKHWLAAWVGEALERLGYHWDGREWVK